MKDIGLYINFPFCTKKCKYCDFHSFDGMHEFMPAYINTLKIEIKSLERMLSDCRISTIFMGGGTPTLFHENSLKEIVDVCYDKLNVSADVEITIESNPATIEKRKLQVLLESGVNRLSIGLQSGQSEHLKMLGRQHTIDDFTQAVRWAREVGFENINADLLLSVPGQSCKDLLDTIELAAEAMLTHVSLYSLRLEEHTPLFDAMQRKEIKLPTDDSDRNMFYEAMDKLLEYDFVRYEISNFAKNGFECEHNKIYWNNKEYIGCGSNAHSYFMKSRYANHSGIADYIQSVSGDGGTAKAFRSDVSIDEERFDTMMLGLRLTKGIGKTEFKERFGQNLNFFYKSQIDILKAQGLIDEDEDRLFCTQKGLDLQNYVALKFLD